MIIDLHTHVLHAIDDGAQTIEESLSLLKAQQTSGVECVVCTPHFLYSSQQSYVEFLSKRNRLFDELKEKRPEVKLILGTEVLFSIDLLDVNLQPLTLNESRYILIEFSTHYAPNHLVNRMEELLAQGFVPIIAHVERYPYLIQNIDLMIELISRGLLFQVNASTLINLKHQKLIATLIKQNLIHLIASDCHNLSSRKPNLMEAYDVVAQKYGTEVRDYFINNAVSVINDQSVIIKEPKNPKGFFHFLKR